MIDTRSREEDRREKIQRRLGLTFPFVAVYPCNKPRGLCLNRVYMFAPFEIIVDELAMWLVHAPRLVEDLPISVWLHPGPYTRQEFFQLKCQLLDRNSVGRMKTCLRIINGQT